MAPSWQAPFGLAVGAALLWSASASAPAASPVTPAAIVTPAPSGDAWRPDEISKLAADLDALLTGAPALRGAHVGVLALETRSGTPLYARGADDDFQVASSTKLIVGSVALERLGPAFRFRTTALLDAQGTLVLRGGGDPFLGLAEMADLAATVAASGVRSLRDVEIDDAAFERSPYPPGWTLDDVPYDYNPVVSALSFEENVIHLSVAPGAAPLRPALVNVPGFGLARPAPGACAPSGEVVVIPAAITGPAESQSTLDLERDPGGCIRVVGAAAAGAPAETLNAAVPSAPLYARRALLGALRAKGIAISEPAAGPSLGEHRYGGGPGAALHEIWAHDSPPLADFLGPRFWIPSDNLVAELLLRELGLRGGGAPGTTANGIALETSWLAALGVDTSTLALFDGSGLSRYDRLTPRALVTVLQHDWNGPYRALVLDSVPVGGARGTIEGLAGTAAAGRVFAKTGSFMHVRGLAGYLATARHGAVTFAFVVDDWNDADYAALAALRARLLSRIITD